MRVGMRVCECECKPPDGVKCPRFLRRGGGGGSSSGTDAAVATGGHVTVHVLRRLQVGLHLQHGSAAGLPGVPLTQCVHCGGMFYGSLKTNMHRPYSFY